MRGPVGVETGVVAKADLPACGLGLVVIGQNVAEQSATAGFAEVAELVTQQKAAFAQITRLGRVIIIGRQIEIIRNRDIDTAHLGYAEVGTQQSRHAPVIDGEIHVGRVHERHIHKLEPGSLRGSHAGFLVDLHPVRVEYPVLVTGGTTGVTEVFVAGQRAAIHVGQSRGSASGDRGNDELGVAEHRPIRLAIHETRIAGQDHSLVLISHVAMGVDCVGFQIARDVIPP